MTDPPNRAGRRLDLAAAAFSVVAVPVAMVDAEPWVALPLGGLVLLFALRVVLRRPHVLLVLAVATTTVTLLNVDLFSEGAFFFVCIAAFRAAADLGRSWLLWTSSAIAAFSPLAASMTNAPDVEGWNWPFWTMGIGISACFGLVVFEQRRLVTELERARRVLADQAVKDERRRLARDVHDLVGHGLTVVLLHLSGAKRHMDRDPETARAAIDQAEVSARHSLAEIRRTVGSLRDAGEGARTHPVELDLAVLVDRIRGAGLQVSHEHVGQPLTALDPGTGIALHRIVQESLANALRHGAEGHVELRTELHSNRVRATVLNATGEGRMTVPSGGTGVIGMQERASALGGSVEIDSRDGRWVVEIELPRHAPEVRS